MEEKIITKGETDYKLRLFPTMLGLKIQRRLATSDQNVGPEPETIFEVVSNGCYINTIGVTAKKFDEHFKGKYTELIEIFYEILAYNFGGDESPNVSSGTED